MDQWLCFYLSLTPLLYTTLLWYPWELSGYSGGLLVIQREVVSLGRECPKDWEKEAGKGKGEGRERKGRFLLGRAALGST